MVRRSMGTNSKHVTVQLGIWTVVQNKSSSFVSECLFVLRCVAEQVWGGTWGGAWDRLAASESPEKFQEKGIKDGTLAAILKLHCRAILDFFSFVREVYSLGPLYCFVGIFICFWKMISGALRLYFSTRILSLISQCLESHQFDSFAIMRALACRVILSFLSEYVSKVGEGCDAVLGERVKYHFLQKSMHTALSLDLLTAEDPEVRNKLEGITGSLNYRSDACEAFHGIKETISRLLTILSELSIMLSMSRSSSTFALSTVFCLVHPLLSLVRYNLYSTSFIAFCNNSLFARMASLHDLAVDERFREERLCNNLECYIEKEFKNNRTALGDVSTEDIYYQWSRKQPVYSGALKDLSWDFSLVLFALRVLWDHTSISMEELILIQQATKSVQGSSYGLFYNMKEISRHLLTIRNLYSLGEIQNKVKDGETRYPRYPEKAHSGAKVEFRNVSFKYPGTNKNALTDLSFTIEPGQLVVIVGVNGSGKSSTIKLLARLYDPNSGEIHLDDLPLTSYKLADVRRAMAILRQDHPVLPLSLRENVALGLPERDVSNGEVEEAVCLGGADKFMHKLKQGKETVLCPVRTAITNFVGDPDAGLKAVLDDKETKTDLSGGETQRLSASRTFMRLMGGNIHLLVADEPTSALDPGGEYELFTRLREQSGGKTVIFITHRFGHLTKYADLILCLKDGHLVEQGTHEKLIDMDGEYKKLYNIQAKAFVS